MILQRHLSSCALGAILYSFLASHAVGQTTGCASEKPITGLEATPPMKSTVPQKAYSVAFTNVPWTDVLDWFEKETGLVLIGTTLPKGTVTIKTEAGKKYTIPEVVDLLNRSLALQKLILLRVDSTTNTVLPTDERIPREFVGRIRESDLASWGDTEVVQVVIVPKSANVDEILDQVRLRLSPFGEVKAVAGNRLLITDTAGTIRAVIADLKLQCESHGVSLIYPCKHVLASEAAKKLATLLDWPVPFLPKREDRTRSVQIAVQTTTNSVLVTGPADQLATAFEILQYLDGVRTGKDEVVLGIYPVPAKSAEALAKLLNERYGSSKLVRFAAVPGKGEIMLHAPLSVHFDLGLLIGKSKEVVQPACVAVPTPCPPRGRLFPRLTCRKLCR
jgi:type II secretory pathway component GspD/PulD (secretin)